MNKLITYKELPPYTLSVYLDICEAYEIKPGRCEKRRAVGLSKQIYINKKDTYQEWMNYILSMKSDKEDEEAQKIKEEMLPYIFGNDD